MQAREKTKVLTGGIMLITVGILILLNYNTEYVFSRTWPVFLVVIAAGILIQKSNDAGGWILGAVGVTFLALKNWFVSYENYANYGLPLLLIALGVLMFFRKSKR